MSLLFLWIMRLGQSREIRRWEGESWGSAPSPGKGMMPLQPLSYGCRDMEGHVSFGVCSSGKRSGCNPKYEGKFLPH